MGGGVWVRAGRETFSALASCAKHKQLLLHVVSGREGKLRIHWISLSVGYVFDDTSVKDGVQAPFCVVAPLLGV